MFKTILKEVGPYQVGVLEKAHVPVEGITYNDNAYTAGYGVYNTRTEVLEYMTASLADARTFANNSAAALEFFDSAEDESNDIANAVEDFVQAQEGSEGIH